MPLLRFDRVLMPMRRIVLAAALAACGLGPAGAAQVAGVTLADTTTVGTTRLVLNGIGLRTYSMLSIHIYVAGLYLQQPSHNGDAILASPGIKLVQMHFVHDVGADSMRGTWRKGLTRNCVAPCVLSQTLLTQFLTALRPVKAGENVTLVFRPQGADAYYDGKPVGHIADVQFAKLMLAVFIGQNAAVPALKQELLGN
jgi:hypothetical protein